jgi:hypothetical protein
MPDGNGGGSGPMSPSGGKLISFDRFLPDRPVNPQKRFRDKNRKSKIKPNRMTCFRSNALNGRERRLHTPRRSGR